MSLVKRLRDAFVENPVVIRSKLRAFLKNGELILFIIPVLLVGFIMLFPRESIFSVKANTNVVSLTFASNQLNQWDVSSGSLITDPFETEAKVLDELDAYILLNPGVKAQVRMLADELHVAFNHDESVGHIDSASLSTKLGEYAELIIPIKNERLFPFNAALMMGEDVSVGVSHILREATVTIVEQQLFKNDRYQAGEYELEMGDKLTFYREDGVSQPAGNGVIVVSEEDGMEVVSHTSAQLARVERLGSSGYDIRASVWARLMHDPIIAAITTLMATIFLSLEFIIIVRRFVTGKE